MHYIHCVSQSLRRLIVSGMLISLEPYGIYIWSKVCILIDFKIGDEASPRIISAGRGLLVKSLVYFDKLLHTYTF